MTVSEMVAAVKAQGKTEKPTKGLTEWTARAEHAQAMAALGFTVVPATNPRTGETYWRINCNGNRFRAIRQLWRGKV